MNPLHSWLPSGLWVLFILWGPVVSGPVVAQELDYDLGSTLAMVQDLKQPCPLDTLIFDCELAKGQAVAILAQVVAEAGNSGDRGTFIDLIRAVVDDPSPEIRTSALYALAKLGPDASDTPVLRRMLRDPVSNVRAGAWAAASMSADPVAKTMALQIEDRPEGEGYGADPAPFDPEQLSVDLPADAEFLWLAAASRERGQLHFLTTQTVDQTVAHFARQSGAATEPFETLFETLPPETLIVLIEFLDAQLFPNAQVVTFGEAATPTSVFVVVYENVAFDQTGFAIIFADGRNLQSPPYDPPELDLSLGEDFDAAAFDAAVISNSGYKPDAPKEESDLFLSVLSAYGYGADLYLGLYPEGAYAAEARDILAGPRLILDGVTYADNDIITADFANVPPGSTADLSILSVSEDYAEVAVRYVSDTAVGEAIDPQGRLLPGVYLMQASVWPADGGEPIILRRDFAITPGVADLATDKTDFGPGEAITVRFSGMSGDSQDYVAVALAGSANGSFATYAYTGGVREGTVTLQAPTTPGSYELRAFFREDESVLRASLPITVGGAAPLPDVVTPPEPPAADEVVAPSPDDPAADAVVALTLDKATYAPGEAITITYTGMFGDPWDYLAIADAGSEIWSRYSHVYTGPREGTATLAAPTAPGNYEIRAFFRDDDSILHGMVTFKVQ